MSSAIAEAIARLEQELAGLEAKRRQIETALDALRRIDMGQVDMTVIPGRRIAQPETRRATPAKAGTREARERQPAKAEDGDAVTERILAALRKAGEPVKPGDLKAAAGVSAFTLRQRLAALAKQGLVVLSGVTAGRRVALAGAPAKEALHRGSGRRRRS